MGTPLADPVSAPAPLTLLTGPPGSGRSTAALERVRAAATAAGARGRVVTGAAAALVLVPTYGEAQHALRSALARWDARGLFDDVFVTFTSAGERFLPGFRVAALPSAEERDRLLLEALRRTRPPAFEATLETRGLRARLLRLAKDVKQGESAPASSFARLRSLAPGLPSGPHERLLAALDVLDAYQALLRGAGLEDHEDALHRLLAALGSPAPGAAPGTLVVDGFDDFTPLEAALLQALVRRTRAGGGEVVVTLPRDDGRPGLFAAADALRARLLGLGFEERSLTGFARAPGGALAHLAAQLFHQRPTRREAGAEVEAWRALDPDDEADLVARRVRSMLEGPEATALCPRGARDVLVVVPDLARRGARVEAALARLGVPVARVGARALLGEPWVQAVHALLPVLAGRTQAPDVDASRVLSALRQAALDGGRRGLLEQVDRQELAWRRQGFPAGWEALRVAGGADLRAELDALEALRVRLARPTPDPVGSLLRALARLLPLPLPAPPDAAGRPTDPAADRALARRVAAWQRLARLLADRVRAATRAGAPPTPAQAAADLVEALPEAAFELPERRLDVVHVLDPETARGWEAPVVVVAGLDEESLPRRPVDDPLLPDEARERLAADGLPLPTSAAHVERERRRLTSLLTRAARRLVLVRPARTPEGDELPPSPLLTEIRRCLDLGERAPEPGPAPGVPALAEAVGLADLGAWSAAALRLSLPPAERALAAALRTRLVPDLLRRAARWRRRVADPLPPEARPRQAAAVERLSASALEAALSCPQRHFLTRVVGVPDEETPLGGPGFGAADLGSVLHAAFRRALLAPAEPAEEVAAAVLREIPLRGAAARFAAEETARAVSLLREREAATAGPFRPLTGWLERRLGADGRGVPLGSGGGAFRLEGRLDRLDVSGRQALVVDYKLGATAPIRHARAAEAGTDLQLLLYALAVELEAGYEVVGLEWVSALRRSRVALVRDDVAASLAPRREQHAPRLLAPEELRARLEAAGRLAAETVARLRAGDHALAPRDEAACADCPVAEACRPDRAWLRRALAPPGGARGAGSGDRGGPGEGGSAEEGAP